MIRSLMLRFYDSMAYQLLFDRHFLSPQKFKNRGWGLITSPAPGPISDPPNVLKNTFSEGDGDGNKH